MGLYGSKGSVKTTLGTYVIAVKYKWGEARKSFSLFASGGRTDPKPPGYECPELWNQDIGV